MKKQISTSWSIIFLFLVGIANGQAFDSTRLYPVPINNKWGYIDCKGEMVLEPMYDYASDFSYNNELAEVRQGKLYGVIDRGGNLIIPCVYKGLKRCWMIKDAYGDLYIAWNGVKYGVINKKNEIIIPFDYKKIKAIPHLFVVNKAGLWGALNVKNETIIPIKFKKIQDWETDQTLVLAQDTLKKWGIFTKKGEVICAPIFDYGHLAASENYISGLSNGRPLSINYKGKKQRRLKMKVSKFYNKNTAIARGKNKLYGLINQDYKWIIKPKYKALSYTAAAQKKQVVLFMKDEKWGLMDLDENVLLKPTYEVVDFITENILAVSDDGQWYRLWNWSNQKWLSEHKYLYCSGDNDFGMIYFKTMPPNEIQPKWGLLDTSGREILPAEYEMIHVREETVLVHVLLEPSAKETTGLYSIPQQKFILPPLFNKIDYHPKWLTKVHYKEAFRNKIAYLTPDGAVVWSAEGFDAKRLLKDYYDGVEDGRDY